MWRGTPGSGRPLLAVWLTNATGLTLDGGSFSVIEANAFAGEGDQAAEPCHIARSEHYIVLSTMDVGAPFLRRLERDHEKIREVFPFSDSRERRLMPLVLMKNFEEYRASRFYLGPTGATAGLQFGNTFVTWYRAPEDSELLQQMVGEIFVNRLFLPGGGRWIHEGAANYLQFTRAQLHTCAELGTHGRTIPLEDVFAGKGFDGSRLWVLDDNRHPWRRTWSPEKLDAGMQSALLIAFLREDPRFAQQFPRFLAKAATVPPDDPALVERISIEAFGLDIHGLEKTWIDWVESEAGNVTCRNPFEQVKQP
jgi:hypothetical protein